MQPERKVQILARLLYVYAGVQTFLFLLGLSGTTFNGDALRDLFNGGIHILLVLGIAYYLPRKRIKSMYWASTAVIIFEVIRKIVGTGLLLWLKQSGQTSEAFPLTPFMIVLAVAFSGVFVIATAIILQRDVRAYLSTPMKK